MNLGNVLVGCFASAFTPLIGWLLAGLIAALAALAAAVPGSRDRLKTGGVMLAAAVLGLVATSALRAADFPERGLAFRACEGLSHFLLATAVIHTGGVLVFDLLLPRMRLGLTALIQDLLLAVAYAAAALTVLSHAGANLSSLLATSAVVTAVMAFSLQETLGNIFGGMVLHLESSFSAGDRIRVGHDEGLVREVRWRQTTLETLDGDTIIIPNAVLMKSNVTILGRQIGQPIQRFASVQFNVYYDRSPGEVTGAVRTALREDTPRNVSSAPPPDCVVAELKDAYAVYAVNYYLTDLSSPGSTASEVRSRVYYALTRAGIKLSNPHRSVMVTQKDEDVQARFKRLEAERRLSALRGVDIFGSLTAEELRLLSERLKPSPFSGGELITRQGAAAEWLYIVYQGEAEVRLYSQDGSSFQAVKRLKPGDFLGEMGLMTGEARTATVVADGEVGCYRLDRESFTDILLNRPAIAEAISQVLAARKVELGVARMGLSAEMRRQSLQNAQGDLLSRIRSIFSLKSA